MRSQHGQCGDGWISLACASAVVSHDRTFPVGPAMGETGQQEVRQPSNIQVKPAILRKQKNGDHLAAVAFEYYLTGFASRYAPFSDS